VTSPTVEAVLWDFGGVFTPSPFTAIADAAAELGISRDRAVAYVFGPYDRDTDHPWHRLERGELTMDAAREQIMAAARADGVTLDPWDLLMRMATVDGPLTNPAVLETAQRVRGRGLRTAVVTNNIAELRDGWRSLVPVDELFDVVIDSSEEGVRKPDPRIFALALERLDGVDPARSVFLDDHEGNITAARAAGLHAILVDADPTPALDELADMVGL
jgi:epoxide hydrolase-like predicted phosphatase